MNYFESPKTELNDIGSSMYHWLKELFPICRSLTGQGVRETLDFINNIVPELNRMEINSGETVFDWQVPEEWEIIDAYIEDSNGNRIVDFKDNNLHVVGYSIPVNIVLTLDDLQNYLYSSPVLPDAIPYVTSYYEKTWGFCISQQQRDTLKPGLYKAVINSRHFKGVMNYADIVIPGELKDEVLLSTYICHPSMANNELSGPVVAMALYKWLTSFKHRKYTYRIVFVPETIGAIVYLSKNLNYLKSKVKAGFQITCVGDDNCYSYLPTRLGNTQIDKIAQHVLKHIDKNFKKYNFSFRGSDERQYCFPGVDLPVVSIMRSKYNEYVEYHTSGDDLNFVSKEGLLGGFLAIKACIEVLEMNLCPIVKTTCEPQLGKRGLYPNLSISNNNGKDLRDLMDIIIYSDGNHTLLDIAEIVGLPFDQVYKIYFQLAQKDILSEN